MLKILVLGIYLLSLTILIVFIFCIKKTPISTTSLNQEMGFYEILRNLNCLLRKLLSSSTVLKND